MFILPKYYMITGADPLEREDFIKKLTFHMRNGTTLIQLRAKNLTTVQYAEIAKRAVRLAKEYQAKLILNTDIEIYQKLDADGIHLTSDTLMQLQKRPLPLNKLVSAACHNQEQLVQAKKIGVDFVTLSPVLPTKTHPEAMPLGWEKFSELCNTVKLPIYALGGMNKEKLNLALSYGAQGIAAISALWD